MARAKRVACYYCPLKVSSKNLARHIHQKHGNKRPANGLEPVLIPRCVLEYYRFQREDKATNVTEADMMEFCPLNYGAIALAIGEEMKAECMGCIWNSMMEEPCDEGMHAAGCRQDPLQATVKYFPRVAKGLPFLSREQICQAITNVCALLPQRL